MSETIRATRVIAGPRLWFGLLLVTHALAVLCSRGYFQFDEHYQVLELIQWKLGLTHAADMPWELGERMRPWLHPLPFFPLEWLSLHVFGLSPFVKTTVHRSLVAALALYVMSRRSRREPAQLALYATLFFYPFLDARISSEVIGGWLFALGDSLDEEQQDARAGVWATLGCGLVLGLAAVIRLHVLVCFAGLLVHHVRRGALRRCGLLCLGVLSAYVLGAACDAWGYGTFTVVPWNYVYQNIVLGKAVRFGSGASPWYWYVPALLRATLYLPGLALIAALLCQWLRRPLSRLSLITLPFVLLHFAVAHKELRYLFVLAPFAPALLLSLWRALRHIRFARAAAAGCMASDLVLLLPAALHDADPEVSLYATLHTHKAPSDRSLGFVSDTNPLGPWRLHPSYYVNDLGLTGQRVPTPTTPVHGLLMVDGPDAYVQLRDAARCELIATRYPRSILDHWPSWLPPNRGPWFKLWSLWRCP